MIHDYAGPALQSTVIGLMKLGSRFEFATGNRGQAKPTFAQPPWRSRLPAPSLEAIEVLLAPANPGLRL